MTDAERQALADLLRNRRHELGLSGREVARRAGIDNRLLSLLDQRKIAQPRVDTIRGLARALDLPLADLYAAANWLPDGALPSLRPYMRATYQDLPDEALVEVEQFIDQLMRQHKRGPKPGEDE